MKLGNRLQALFDTLSKQPAYEEIWDCCCDHGYLGIAILDHKVCYRVHFVDQVEQITYQLQERLIDFHQDSYTITTDCASKIMLDPEKRQLIILAGISGKTVIKIMKGIINQNRKLSTRQNAYPDVSFLLSPNYHLYEVRQYLIDTGLHLIAELLICENNRANEVILVSLREPGNKQTLSTTGNMWNLKHQSHIDYLNDLMNHYQRKTHDNNNRSAKRILEEYKALSHK